MEFVAHAVIYSWVARNADHLTDVVDQLLWLEIVHSKYWNDFYQNVSIKFRDRSVSMIINKTQHSYKLIIVKKEHALSNDSLSLQMYSCTESNPLNRHPTICISFQVVYCLQMDV